MFEQTRELWLVYIPHLTVFNQRHEKPESKRFRAVEEDLRHDKIHALNVLDLALVVRERNEDTAQFLMAPASDWLHEVVMARKCSAQITLNLIFRIFVRLHLD